MGLEYVQSGRSCESNGSGLRTLTKEECESVALGTGQDFYFRESDPDSDSVWCMSPPGCYVEVTTSGDKYRYRYNDKLDQSKYLCMPCGVSDASYDGQVYPCVCKQDENSQSTLEEIEEAVSGAAPVASMMVFLTMVIAMT